MFERVVQTEGYKDADALEGRSTDQVVALRLAAAVLVVNASLTMVIAVVVQRRPLPLISTGISLGLAYYLFKLRPRAEGLALGLTILNAIVQTVLPALMLLAPNPAAAFRAAVPFFLPGWGLVAALLLLLTGDSGRARRVTAIVLFGLLTVGSDALLIVEGIVGPG